MSRASVTIHPGKCPPFDKFACISDLREWTRDGFELRARLEHDPDSSPEDLNGPGFCYWTGDPEHGEENQKIIDAWKADEWHYCGVIVTASRAGVELGRASLWGIELNFPESDNAYLSEAADELAPEAIEEARRTLERLKEEAA